jgi:flagellar basal body-associated protein FliL
MNFLTKLENIINHFIFRLSEMMVKHIKKVAPTGLQIIWSKFLSYIETSKAKLKALPKQTLTYTLQKVKWLKSLLLTFDFRSKLTQTFQTALAQYKEKRPKSISKLKTALLAPFLILGQWLQGLSAAQSMLLLTFSAASFLAGINMIFSGQRLMSQNSTQNRTPASIEEELKYDRPGYYKRQERHLELTNMRLPVYIAKLNEIKSVDIDFTITLTNRNSRKFLSKHEFELRDHIILNMEPLIATFPLEDEGKEVLRQKIWKEIDIFMEENKIEGSVEDLKLTYILAN